MGLFIGYVLDRIYFYFFIDTVLCSGFSEILIFLFLVLHVMLVSLIFGRIFEMLCKAESFFKVHIVWYFII